MAGVKSFNLEGRFVAIYFPRVLPRGGEDDNLQFLRIGKGVEITELDRVKRARIRADKAV